MPSGQETFKTIDGIKEGTFDTLEVAGDSIFHGNVTIEGTTTPPFGTVSSVSASVPSYLAVNVTNPTTTPAIAITSATGAEAPSGTHGLIRRQNPSFEDRITVVPEFAPVDGTLYQTIIAGAAPSLGNACQLGFEYISDNNALNRIRLGLWGQQAVSIYKLGTISTSSSTGTMVIDAGGGLGVTGTLWGGVLKSDTTVSGTQLQSSTIVAPPLTVASAQRVTNLNAATCGTADLATDTVSKTGTGSTYVANTNPTIKDSITVTPTAAPIDGTLYQSIIAGAAPTLGNATQIGFEYVSDNHALNRIRLGPWGQQGVSVYKLGTISTSNSTGTFVVEGGGGLGVTGRLWTASLAVDSSSLVNNLYASRAAVADTVTGVASGQQTIVYSTGASSGIGGYNNDSFGLGAGPQVDAGTAVDSGTSPVLIQGFITPVLGITSIPSGVWTINNYAKVDLANGTCAVRTEVYKRTSGGVETSLFSNTGTTITSTSTLLYAEVTNQGSFTLAATDRLVFKYYATNSSPTSRTVTFSYDGSVTSGNVVIPLIGYFQNLTVGNNASVTGDVTANAFTSTQPTGTPPFTVNSTTQVPNLYVTRSALADAATNTSSKTGNGSTYATNDNPTFINPILGNATATSLTTGSVTSDTGAFTSINVNSVTASTDRFTGSVVLKSEYTFTIIGTASATVGAIYTNNGNSFTVKTTIVSGSTLVCYGLGNPSGFGSLTLFSGTGDTPIGFSSVSTLNGGLGVPGLIYADGENLSGLNASSAVATDASKNLVSVTNTGTGNNVLATNPTIKDSITVTPTAAPIDGTLYQSIIAGAAPTLGNATQIGFEYVSDNHALNRIRLGPWGQQAVSVYKLGTVSTSSSTGTLVVDSGGLGVQGDIYSGASVNGTTLSSTIATGTAPLAVTSTTVVPNLYTNKSQVATCNKFSTVTSAGGTTTLTVISNQLQRLIGSANQTFTLPNATTLETGWIFIFDNQSTGVLTITNATPTTIATLSSGGYVKIVCTDISTGAGTWDVVYSYKNSTGNTSTVVLQDAPTLTGQTTFGTATSTSTDINLITTSTDKYTGTVVLKSEYTFTVSLVSATAGAVYTNNGNSFIVKTTIVAGSTLVCYGIGPTFLTFGSLVKISGTGDDPISFTAVSILKSGLGVPGRISGETLSSDVSTGTSPLTVASTTRVTNLNAATCGNADTVTTSSNLFPASTFNQYGVAYGNTGTALGSINPLVGDTGKVLVSSGTTGPPSWQSIPGSTNVNANWITQLTSTATAAGTTTLTVTSNQYQEFTGTTTQNVKLPDATTLIPGHTFEIINNSTGLVTVQYNDASTLSTVKVSGGHSSITLKTNGTTNGTWQVGEIGPVFTTSTGSGNVVLANTPTLITPNIGAATGTSINLTGDATSTTASVNNASSASYVLVDSIVAPNLPNAGKVASTIGKDTSTNSWQIMYEYNSGTPGNSKLIFGIPSVADYVFYETNKITALGHCTFGNAVPNETTITTTGSTQTYNTPANVKYLIITCVGGGGGGESGGGGGGGGAMCRHLISSPASSYHAVIGAAGTGVGPTAGGDTSFLTSADVVIIKAGGGGAPPGGGFGGNGGLIITSGNKYGTTGSPGLPSGGSGLGGASGIGGGGGNASSGTGNNATGLGGGGGAGAPTFTGGNGSQGIVIIEEHYI